MRQSLRMASRARTRAPLVGLATALAVLLVGCGGSGGDKAGGRDDADATPALYRDAVGDAGSQPDIRTIEVASRPDGQISFRVTLGHFTSRSKTGVDLWLDTDADPETGNTTFDDAGGAEFQFAAFPPGFNLPGCSLPVGNGCLSRFSPGTWVAATAPTASVSRTPTGFTFSINRSDLGDTDELNFYAIYGTPDGFTERAPGTGTFNYSLALGGSRTEASAQTGEQADKAGGKPEGAPVVLTLANHDYASFDSGPGEFAAAVERLSGGSIDIKVRYGFRYYDLDEKGTIADVQSGTVDAALVGARAWDTVGVTSFQALLAPFLVDSYALERRVLESELVDRMLEGVEPLGLVGLAIVPGELRRPFGTSRVLVRPEDYEGALIGIRPSSLSRATFEALGARAKRFGGPDALAGFDGAESGVHTIQGNGYDAGARALTANVVLWPRAVTIFINQRVFDALTDDQQNALRRAGIETVEPLLATIQETEQSALDAICQRSHLPLVIASPADRRALRRAVQPVYDKLERDPLARELISEIEDMSGNELGAADEPLRCPKALPGGDAEALQGLWRVTVTRKELLAAGAQLEQLERAQGSWTLELKDGRWIGRNLDSGNLYRGTYAVDGKLLRETVRSCAPTNICTPGSVEEYTWSVYRDRLELAPIPGRLFNLAAVAKPLTRIR